MMNDPKFPANPTLSTKEGGTFSCHSTQTTNTSEENGCKFRKCVSHSQDKSFAESLQTFRAKPIQVRRKFLSDYKICYGCCNSDKHMKRDCQERAKCDNCGSEDHPSALHVTSKYTREKQGEETDSSLLASQRHGGEKHSSRGTQREKRTNCTEIYESSSFPGKSCAKLLLVRVYCSSHPDKSVLTYALIDDQSNRSLATTHLLNLLDVN